MPTYLHQIIAVERTADAEAKRDLDAVRQILSVGGDQNPLTGLSRTHERKTDADVQQPPESRRVQMTTGYLIGTAVKSLTWFVDVKFTREYGNTQARADVVLDGKPLLADVPAGYLLFLESQVAELIKLIERLQILDPAEEWHQSPSAQGVWESAPRETLSTTKKPVVQQLAEATQFHPAQVRTYDANVVTGTWALVKYSGQLPGTELQGLRRRAVKLLDAVKHAREQANRQEVTNKKAGEAVLGYIFGDLLA